MALENFGQLMLNVQPHPIYEDGDILCAFPRCHIHHVHIQHICRPRDAKGKLPGGMLGNNTLLEFYLARVSQYRFTRLSRHEVRRTLIANGTHETFNHVANAKGEYGFVAEYLARRKRAGKLPLFGVAGEEVWYKGHISINQPVLDTIWDEIERKTLYRRANYDHWPLTPAEKKQFFGISVDDFTNEEAGELVSPLLAEAVGEEEPRKLKERKNQINWRDLVGVVSADILDADKSVDVRADYKHVRKDIVIEKARI